MEQNAFEKNSESPFLVEPITAIDIPKPEDYLTSYENPEHIEQQENNPNLISFTITKNDTITGYIIDKNNPTNPLVKINFDHNKDQYLVNNTHWKSLNNKNPLKWGAGYSAVFEPEKGLLGMYTKNGEIVVNNNVWQTPGKYHNIYTGGGSIYSLITQTDKPMLVIDDREWICTHYESTDGRTKIDDAIKYAKIGEKGTVVAVIRSGRNDNIKTPKFFISIGDKTNEHHVWQNTLGEESEPKQIAIDDTYNHIAVFGILESRKTGILVDDVPYEIPDNPEELEYMEFTDGSLIIQYQNTLGETITQKISIQENAKAIQEARERITRNERALAELQRLLITEKIPMNEILQRLQAAEQLEQLQKELAELERHAQQIFSEKQELADKLRKGEEKHEEEQKNMLSEKNELQARLRQIQHILSGTQKSGGGFFGGEADYKISEARMREILDLVK